MHLSKKTKKTHPPNARKYLTALTSLISRQKSIHSDSSINPSAMDGSLGEMSLHGHAELHSRDLSAAFPRPPLSAGPPLEPEPRAPPPPFEHAMSALGYSGDSPSGSGSTYTTLTPLQPFDDKFHHHHHHHHPCLPVSNVIGSFTLMREERAGLSANFYNPYAKDLAMSQSLTPPSSGLGSMHSYGSPNGGGGGGGAGQMLHGGYDVHGGSLFCRTSDFGREMSPPGLGAGDMSMGHQLNKMDGPAHHSHIYSGSGGGGGEEINTRDVAQRIITELKRYSIPQAIFAERILCRSQGTLSDLLRNPKPWAKLKSGRETFKRMSRWLQEPEFQRMASLRLEGENTCTHTHLHRWNNGPHGRYCMHQCFQYSRKMLPLECCSTWNLFLFRNNNMVE
uniref:One cut domain, family member, like n=1 Tax=Hippocampus comes TaxID=109280 RepID=A0A3Q2Z7P4_HIPCM